ncbi:MAG: DNA polymerase III subunit delta' [Actinobacteria bacterium]|nr:DNA polymerase III subunit delta' [Actinomycetota bacterium]
MRGLFADIVGQEMAVSILTRALEQGAVHAYLFAGPPGVGKTSAALAFAAGLACEDKGCGTCSTCRRVQQGLHPDVEVIAPEGNFIRKEEITDINMHAAYRPFEARAKVYIFLEADNFNIESANAFLKTLEEPPAHVYFILVTDHPERLLPTIVSRCQVVAFSSVSLKAMAKDLRNRFGLAAEEADLTARAAGGNLSYARELATSESARRQRELLLDLARDLPAASLMATQSAVDEVMATVARLADERVESLGAELQQALEWAGDARTRSWLTKRHEEKLRRQQRRLTTQGLNAVTRIYAGWYRDLAAVSVGAEGAVLNQDRVRELNDRALPGGLVGYMQAVLAVRQTQERLRYNVDAKCAITDMFRTIKEALTQWPMS